jgi:uncharacterized membrane protein
MAIECCDGSSRRLAMRMLGYAAAFAIGAFAMYELDGSQGRRRRARLRDGLDHVSRATVERSQKAWVDASNRMHGATSRMRRRSEESADDVIVNERVRACLGRHTSHAHAIHVTTRDGVVELRGAILAAEAAELVENVKRVTGVLAVIDGLDHHLDASTAPELAGGRPLGPRARLELGVFGGAVEIVKTVTLHAPIGQVFSTFVAFESFPMFMRHVREVRPVDRGRWHWKVDGPLGRPLEWDAIVTRFDEPEHVSWTTTERAPVHHRGDASFEPTADGGTRLTLRIVYEPPFGLIGHTVARLLGVDPKHELEDELIRFKSLLENGHVTGRHGSFVREQIRRQAY